MSSDEASATLSDSSLFVFKCVYDTDTADKKQWKSDASTAKTEPMSIFIQHAGIKKDKKKHVKGFHRESTYHCQHC